MSTKPPRRPPAKPPVSDTPDTPRKTLSLDKKAATASQRNLPPHPRRASSAPGRRPLKDPEALIPSGNAPRDDAARARNAGANSSPYKNDRNGNDRNGPRQDSRPPAPRGERETPPFAQKPDHRERQSGTFHDTSAQDRIDNANVLKREMGPDSRPSDADMRKQARHGAARSGPQNEPPSQDRRPGRSNPPPPAANAFGQRNRSHARPAQELPLQIDAPMQFFATCPRGLESVLIQELIQLGAVSPTPVAGGAHFGGDWLTCARANRQSRVASRILWRLTASIYTAEQDIYRAARALPWGQWFTPDDTIRVNTTAQHCPLPSIDFATLLVKDAVCDHFRERTDTRPSVNTENPDVRIHLFLDARVATFYLDTSGDALFKRGWRQAVGDAPLRENLAAGILLLSGWQARLPEGGCEPLIDPMCGSGTFLVEAAAMALDIDPGAGRRFGFQNLRPFPHDEWADWCQARDTATHNTHAATALPLYGADRALGMIQAARENLTAFGTDANGVDQLQLASRVTLTQQDILDIKAPAPTGVWVTNPPYGIRIGDPDALLLLYPRMGDLMKKRFAGWRAYFLSGDPELEYNVRLSASKRVVLFNGSIECRLLEYILIEGSHRKN